MAQPEFYLTGEYTLKGLWFCNSSYTYGVIMHGNKFGASGVATPLSAQVDAGGKAILGISKLNLNVMILLVIS